MTKLAPSSTEDEASSSWQKAYASALEMKSSRIEHLRKKCLDNYSPRNSGSSSTGSSSDEDPLEQTVDLLYLGAATTATSTTKSNSSSSSDDATNTSVQNAPPKERNNKSPRHARQSNQENTMPGINNRSTELLSLYKALSKSLNVTRVQSLRSSICSDNAPAQAAPPPAAPQADTPAVLNMCPSRLEEEDENDPLEQTMDLLYRAVSAAKHRVPNPAPLNTWRPFTTSAGPCFRIVCQSSRALSQFVSWAGSSEHLPNIDADAITQLLLIKSTEADVDQALKIALPPHLPLLLRRLRGLRALELRGL